MNRFFANRVKESTASSRLSIIQITVQMNKTRWTQRTLRDFQYGAKFRKHHRIAGGHSMAAQNEIIERSRPKRRFAAP
ncbi:hypothetical protein F6P94_10160 [Escherichia coli]|nr:hypothetical protein F6P94_10160 [Escherichia coli]